MSEPRPGAAWGAATAAALLAGVGTWLAIGADPGLSPAQWSELAGWRAEWDPSAFTHDPVFGAAGTGLRESGDGTDAFGYLVTALATALGSPAQALRAIAAACAAVFAGGVVQLLAPAARNGVVSVVVALAAVVVRPALGAVMWGCGSASSGAGAAGVALALAPWLLVATWRWRNSRLLVIALMGSGLLAGVHAPTGFVLLAGSGIAVLWEGWSPRAVVRVAGGMALGTLAGLPGMLRGAAIAEGRFAEIAADVWAMGLLPPPSGAIGIAFSAFAPLLLLSHLAWRARRGGTQEPIVRWLAVVSFGAAGVGSAMQLVARIFVAAGDAVPIVVDFTSGTRFLYLGVFAYIAMGMGDFMRGKLFPVELKWRLPILLAVGLALLVPPETLRRSVTAAGRRKATLEAARAQDVRDASAWLNANSSRPVICTDESAFRVLAGAGVTHAEGDAPWLIRSSAQRSIQWAQRRSMWRTAWAQRPPTLQQLMLLGGAFGADYVYVPVLLAPDDARTVWRGQERALIKLAK